MATNYLIPGGGIVGDDDTGVNYLLPGGGVYGFDAADAEAVGLATETDTALGITPVKALTVAVVQATETDSALTISPIKDILIAPRHYHHRHHNRAG